MVAYYHITTLPHESESIMKNQLLHTPDGVRDIYNGECQKKLLLQEKLHHVQQKYGYHDIQTPTFEFFNIFSSEIGTTPSKDLYKFFDKEGNTLVLRPDFTPSIARSAAKYYLEEKMPVKLCYMGNTVINSSDYQGRLKESTQCGAELIGDASVGADAEILAMACDSLLECGLKNFQISVGHAQFFAGLVEAAKLDSEQESDLRDLILNKNFFGVEEFVDNLNLPSELKELFMMLGNFDSKAEDLNNAKTKAANYPAVYDAICSLENLAKYLDIYGISKYISFELGLISDYHYYTGIIFSGYTFGTGEPILKGGRYDKLLSHFGKEAAAIGFGIVVDQLMAALNRQDISLPINNNSTIIVYTQNKAEEAITHAIKLRKQGIFVEMILKDELNSKEDYSNYAHQHHINKVEFMED